MLNLNEYDPKTHSADGVQRHFNYEGFFGGYLIRDGFGLHGTGSLSIDTPQTRINLMGETPLPLVISIPLAFIPVVGRAARTFYRPTVDFAFQFADVSEFVRKGTQIQFKAPKQSGGKPKRVEFLAKTEAEAADIESAVRQYKPEITAGKMVSSWRLAKYVLAAAAVFVGLFLILLIGAGIKRYAKEPARLSVSTNRQLSGTINRKGITKFSELNQYPEAANGIFRSGGNVFLIVTVSPEGNVTDVKISEQKKTDYFPNTDNPILIEAAMNSARQIKYAPDKAESQYEVWFRYQTRLDYALMRY
ncbi:hypothetical protein BH10ACI1_BH10ACI1_12420 [soil metagenome]